jgi:hypothetical protein
MSKMAEVRSKLAEEVKNTFFFDDSNIMNPPVFQKNAFLALSMHRIFNGRKIDHTELVIITIMVLDRLSHSSKVELLEDLMWSLTPVVE